MSWIFTSDKSCFYGYDPETKQQSVLKGCSLQEQRMHVRSGEQSTACLVFSNPKPDSER